MRIINVGLAGIGTQMQERLLPSLLQIPGIRIVAACDSVAGRAEQIQRAVGGIPTMTGVAAMLDAASLDAIVMAGTPQAHRSMAMRAMQRGVGVFAAKAPCSTLEQLRALVDMARQCGVRTGVASDVFRAEREAAWQRAVHEPGSGRPEHGSYFGELQRFFDACRLRIRFEADFESLLASYGNVESIGEGAVPNEPTHAATTEGRRDPLSKAVEPKPLPVRPDRSINS